MIKVAGQGQRGQRGQAATVSVGSVLQGAVGSAPVVTNSGTPSAAIFNFMLPAPRDGTNGTNGSNGVTPTLAIGTVSTLPAGSSATVTIGGTAPNYTLSFGLPQGSAGSNATATPLGTATPKALGNATPGSSTNAAREDHVHPLPAGRLEFIGNLNVSETLLVALTVGMKRKTFALSGVLATDLLLFAPTAAPTSGCEVVNVYPAGAGNISVGYYTPALAIAAAYSMPIAVYRITL